MLVGKIPLEIQSREWRDVWF